MRKNNTPLNIEKVLFVNFIEPMANKRTNESIMSKVFFPMPSKRHSTLNKPTELEVQLFLTELLNHINFYHIDDDKGKQILYYHKSSDTSTYAIKWLDMYFKVIPKNILKKALDEIIKRLTLSIYYTKSIEKGIDFNEYFPFTEIRRTLSPLRKERLTQLPKPLPNNLARRVDLKIYQHIYQLTKDVDRNYWIETVKNN